jgi:hypothetical protein
MWLSISGEPHNFFCIVLLCTAMASSAQTQHGIGFDLIGPNAAIAHQLVADLAHRNELESGPCGAEKTLQLAIVEASSTQQLVGI